MTRSGLGRACDLVADLPAGLRRRLPRRPRAHRRRAPPRAASRRGSTMPSNSARPVSRSGPCSPRRPTATTRSITTRSTRASATTPTSTTSSREARGAWPAHPARRRVQPRRHRVRPLPGGLAGGDDSWFRKGRNGFATFEGHDGLITLNHRNPEVVDYVVDVMLHWLRRGADGWRLDAAYAVPDEFWAQVLPRVRERVPRRVVRRRGHPRRLRGHRVGVDVRLGHAVRAVEGDLEQPQRRQLPRARPCSAQARRVPRRVRAR